MGEVTVLALGVAISPVPIVATLLLLGTPRAWMNGSFFAAGWVLGIAVAATVFVLLARAAGLADRTPLWLAVLQLLLGVAFLLVAARIWRRRHRARAHDVPPWLVALDSFGPLRAGGLGLVLSAANPKNLALTLAAAIALVEAGSTEGGTAEALTAFVLVGAIGVALPVALYGLFPTRSRGVLDRFRVLLVRHDAAVLALLGLVIGARFVWEGLAAL